MRLGKVPDITVKNVAASRVQFCSVQTCPGLNGPEDSEKRPFCCLFAALRDVRLPHAGRAAAPSLLDPIRPSRLSRGRSPRCESPGLSGRRLPRACRPANGRTRRRRRPGRRGAAVMFGIHTPTPTPTHIHAHTHRLHRLGTKGRPAACSSKTIGTEGHTPRQWAVGLLMWGSRCRAGPPAGLGPNRGAGHAGRGFVRAVGTGGRASGRIGGKKHKSVRGAERHQASSAQPALM